MRDPAEFWDKLADKYSSSPVKDMENYNKTLDCTRKHHQHGLRNHGNRLLPTLPSQPLHCRA
ncbi:MAG: hypothetical protein JRE71_01845 [Deltaproteobacteria bacterium]|nr:hypothetical protein [Deltaproteobacteria bacterium]